MSRIYIRRYKQNPDFWEVVGGPHKNVQVLSKTEAKKIAAARRKVQTAMYDVFVHGEPHGEMTFADEGMAYLRKTGYAEKRGVTFRKHRKGTQKK